MKSSELCLVLFGLSACYSCPPLSSSHVNKRDSPYHKPQRAVMKVGEEGWYSELMWPNAQMPYAFDWFLSKCKTLSCTKTVMSKHCFSFACTG